MTAPEKPAGSDIYRDGTYARTNPTWHEEDSPWKARQILRLLERNDLHPATLCEVGCGAGEILRRLAEQLDSRVRCYGYEMSPQAFERCRAKAGQNLTYVCQDLLEENERAFDIVLAIDVFEHIEDYLGFLRKLRDKGTYKIFHIPLDLSVQAVWRRTPIRRAREQMGHLHFFTKETALAALETAGYNVLDWFYTAGSLEAPTRRWTARVLAVPRKLLFALHQDAAARWLGGFSLLVLAQ